MTFSVDIDLGYEFAVKAPFKKVFDLLSDVPKSVSHFPKVAQLVDLGGGVYRWEMEKVGPPQSNVHTVYASKYVSNRSKGTVVWTPVKGEGNALVGGSWKISDNKTSTALVFKVKGSIDIAAPALMKMVIAPVVRHEFEGLVEQYIANLIKRFGGEVE
ncbi:MAG: hypothetical protein ABI564_12530 [Ideonella sp.]